MLRAIRPPCFRIKVGLAYAWPDSGLPCADRIKPWAKPSNFFNASNMWILKNNVIVNTDNVSVIKKDASGNLRFTIAGNTELILDNIPEDAITQIWMAHKKGQDIVVL